MIKIPKFKIDYNKEACIGCGSCEAICPKNWTVKEGKAHPKQTKLEKLDCNEEAADACPVSCIKIVKLWK